MRYHLNNNTAYNVYYIIAKGKYTENKVFFFLAIAIAELPKILHMSLLIEIM